MAESFVDQNAAAVFGAAIKPRVRLHVSRLGWWATAQRPGVGQRTSGRWHYNAGTAINEALRMVARLG